MTHPSRRTFIAGSAALAASAACDTPAKAQTASITGGSESAFPSADAPGSNEGGYNILFILTDQEHYMGPRWPIPLPGHERLRRDRHVLREPPDRSRHVLGVARGDLYRPAHAA